MRQIKSLSSHREAGAYFEHIVVPPERSFLWRMDDYPWRRVVWNYHPEFELHLIRRSSGLAYVGDYIGSFRPGHLVLVGGNLPHNWITPAAGDEIIEKRDIVVQFDGRKLQGLRRDFPEMAELDGLFKRAALGVEFLGSTAVECAASLEALGSTRGLDALANFLTILARLAGSREYRLLSTEKFSDQFKPGSPLDVKRVEQALDYIQKNFRTGVSLSEVAARTGMSDSSFSRFFQSQTGNSFSEHLATIRIWSACKMLSETEKPITEICFDSGFNNISNFNRTFLRRMKLTPSRYRSASGKRSLL